MMDYKWFATMAISIGLSAFVSFAKADDTPPPICPRILNMNTPIRFTDGQMRIGMMALEAAGYKICMRLFQKPDPVADHIFQKALGLVGITVSGNMYDNLPVRKTITAYRNELISTPPPVVERPPAPAKRTADYQLPDFTDAMVKSLYGPEIALIRATQNEWLMRMLKYLDKQGKRLNISALAQEPEAEAFLEAATIAYSGSLYDAIIAAGFDPQPEISFAEPTETVANWLSHFRRFAKPVSGAHLIDDLAEAVSMEYPQDDMLLVKALLVEIATTAETDPTALAILCEVALSKRVVDETGGPITAKRVSALLESFTKNRTLFAFDEALQSLNEQKARLEHIHQFIEGEL